MKKTDKDNVTEIAPDIREDTTEKPPYFGMTVKQRIWEFTRAFQGVEKNRTGARDTEHYFNIDDLYCAVIEQMTYHGIGAVDCIKMAPPPAGGNALLIEVFCLDDPTDCTSSEILLPVGGDGRAFGSSLTYMRRYGLVVMLNVRVPGDDDDGMAAELDRLADEVGSAEGKPLKDIRDMVSKMDGDGTGRTLDYLQKTFGIETFEELSLKQSASLRRTLKDIVRREAVKRGMPEDSNGSA